MLKKLPAVCAGLLLTLSVFAATVELAKDHPDTYTVRKGDTLWTIAAKFLRNPWEWPEVWQANPQIANPHLIFPGDVISLANINGRLSLTNGGNSEGGPHVRAQPLEDAIKPVPLSEIINFLKKPRLVSEEEFKNLPHLVGMEEQYINGIVGQLTYARGLDAQQGQQFVIARAIGRFYEFAPNDGSPKQFYRESLQDANGRPDMLWHHGPDQFTLHGDVHFLGYELIQFGTVRVTRPGDPASALIVTADVEVRRGDFLLPDDDQPYDFQYVPHAPQQVSPGMHVISFTDAALNAVGRRQVISMSGGSADGVENGQVFSIFSRGATATDYTDYPEMSSKAFFHRGEAEVHLPEEYVGHVMVFRTFERVSYGLVVDGIRPVHIGDRLYEPDHK